LTERPACFEIGPMAPAVRQTPAKRRSPLCRTTILADHVTADERQGAWSTRTAFDLRRTRTRNDLLFTMSDNTRPLPRAEARETFYFRTNLDQPTPRPPRRRYAHRYGGARRDRTDDLLLAKQALSQLSYGPFRHQRSLHLPTPHTLNCMLG
jgi:hypothetical protein